MSALADWLDRHAAGERLEGVGVILEGDDDLAHHLAGIERRAPGGRQHR